MKNVLGTTTIEQLVGARGDDRRGKKRFSADEVPTAVAPYVTAPVPKPDMLCTVECQNLSRQGIAFLWPDKPSGRFMLIRLGSPPNPIYLTAKVVGVMRAPGSTGEQLVRCQFIREVDPDAS